MASRRARIQRQHLHATEARESRSAAPAPVVRQAWRPHRRRSLSFYLGLSMAGHVGLFFLFSHVNISFRAAHASIPHFTRVRLVKLDDASSRLRPPVALPGVRVQAGPPEQAKNGPDAAEVQRQLARIQAMRAEFLKPMKVVNAPMPVLPGAPEGPLPPMWGLQLPQGVQPLPGAPAAPQLPDREQLARLLHQEALGLKAVKTAMMSPTKAAAELLKHPLPAVSTPSEAASTEVKPPVQVASAQAASGDTAPPADEGSAPGAASPNASMPAAAGQPVAAGTSAGPGTPAADLEKPAPAETNPAPSSTPAEGTPAPAPDAGSKPAPDAGSKPANGGAAEPGQIPAETSAAAPAATPSDPDTPKANEPGSESAPAATPGVRLTADGPYAGVTGSFRVPVGAAFTGYKGGGSLAFLLKEAATRTRLKLAPAGYAPLASIPVTTPMLYLKGRGTVLFSDPERASLKAYVDAGGTILADGVQGEFGDSLRSELESIFLAAPAPLPADDPLYRACYRLGAVGTKLFPLQAIRIAGRPAILLSTAFLGRRWQDKADPEHEAAVAEGINVLTYAIGRRAKGQ